MRASVYTSALFVALAMATPVKRDVIVEQQEVELHVHTKLFTVTVNGPKPTSVSVPPPPPKSTPPPPATTPAPAAPPPPPAQAKFFEKPPASSPAPAAPAAPAASPVSQASGYDGDVLKGHNDSRAKHGSPALTIDPGLVATAKQIADTCKFGHVTDLNGGNYGQNIAAGTPASQVYDIIAKSFYGGEVSKYNAYGSEPDMTTFKSWGHFTQVVWKSTASVGCYTSACPGGVFDLVTGGHTADSSYTVCNYKQTGNFVGEFAKNVPAPLS